MIVFDAGQKGDFHDLQVYWITDRGPNQGCNDADSLWGGSSWQPASAMRTSAKGFPLERFAPSYGEVDLTSTALTVKGMFPLRYQKSRAKYDTWATGRGTKGNFISYDSSTLTGGDGLAASGDCAETIPGVDPGGLDVEDIQTLRNGQFIASDEYGKIVVFDSTGTILVTYVPVGHGSQINESNTGSPVREVLPASFGLRRGNRGMESIAVSGNKSRAYTCLQSTMDADANSTLSTALGGGVSSIRNSKVIRCAMLDITETMNPRLMSEKYLFSSPISRFPTGSQDNIKLSGAQWLTDDKVMFLVRHDGQTSFEEVDFATGSNLQDTQ